MQKKHMKQKEQKIMHNLMLKMELKPLIFTVKGTFLLKKIPLHLPSPSKKKKRKWLVPYVLQRYRNNLL